MTRTPETVSRHDWDAILGTLNGDLRDQLTGQLQEWLGGETCGAVEYTTNARGLLDGASSPRPGDAANV